MQIKHAYIHPYINAYMQEKMEIAARIPLKLVSSELTDCSISVG
jgi:hypothetical protein